MNKHAVTLSKDEIFDLERKMDTLLFTDNELMFIVELLEKSGYRINGSGKIVKKYAGFNSILGGVVGL